MAARRRCCRRLLLFKIEVRPWPCRPYQVRRACNIPIKWIPDPKNCQDTMWCEGHQAVLLSRPHEHGHFWPNFTIQSQEVEQTTFMLFIMKVLWCSNNLMQKMTFITPSTEISIWKYCSKILLRNFHQIQGLKSYPTVRPVTLELFCPSAIRGPWISLEI